ncbi:SLATT domain-containing protein [Salinicoccus roseus]|uniref:SLATT domain-containing protein n=1 Tax=Salinicoccus roseus TaxID=45670 RepID=UPI001EF75151|nr:SLATT domain-containing protein [Salinicoccus roseus]MCG7331858.1 SLATT domain-containing protein [Salinicoccus roseus]
MDKEIESLINKIWITKKSRMEAEARMRRNYIWSQVHLTLNTFAVLAFSIFTLVLENELLTVLTVIASVGLFGTSLFMSSMRYGERAIEYKQSYLSLYKLESECKALKRNKELMYNHIGKSLIEEEQNDRVLALEKEYVTILSESENHANIDFQSTNIKHNKDNLGGKIFKEPTYYIKRILMFLSNILLLLFLPTLAILIFSGVLNFEL